MSDLVSLARSLAEELVGQREFGTELLRAGRRHQPAVVLGAAAIGLLATRHRIERLGPAASSP